MSKRYFIKTWKELLATEGVEEYNSGFIDHEDRGQASFTRGMVKYCGIQLSNSDKQFIDGWALEPWMIKTVGEPEEDPKIKVAKIQGKFYSLNDALKQYDGLKNATYAKKMEVNRLAKELGIKLKL